MMNSDQLEMKVIEILENSHIRYETVQILASDLFIALLDYEQIEPVTKHIQNYLTNNGLAVVLHVNLKSGESLGLRRSLRNF